MKKILSISLALLMILSSLPIMAFSVSAEDFVNPNVLSNYKAENWFVRSHGSVADSTDTNRGGNAFLANSVNYQKMVTVVNLEANTNYDFSFDWKAVTPDDNGGAGVYPAKIYVYPMSVIGEFSDEKDASATAGSGKWDNNAKFYPTVGDGKLDAVDDIEIKSDAYFDKNKAVLADGKWNSLSSIFKTTEDTEYVVMVEFRANSVGAGKNQIYLSDFALEKSNNIIANATNKGGEVSWSDNSGVYSNAIDGNSSLGVAYSWRFGIPETSYKNNKIAYVYIDAGTLTAGESYEFSYVYQRDYVISIDKITDEANNTVDLLSDAVDTAVTGGDRAHKVSATFTAPADGNYTITLSMCKGKNNTNCKYDSVILGDLSLYAVSNTTSENVLEDYKASNWFARSHGSVADSTASSKGGNSFIAKSVNYQKVVTSVTLEPNTTYNFSFDWKAIIQDDSGAGIFPSHIYVYPKSVIGELSTEKDTAATAGSGKWNDNAAFFPTVGDGKLDAEDDIESKSDVYYDINKETLADGNWNNIFTSFETTEDTEYVIMIAFRPNSVGQGKNQIVLSDATLEKKPIDKNNLLANLSTEDWGAYRHSKITKSLQTRFGGNAISVRSAMYQNVFIGFDLKPGTDYEFSFEWKSIANEGGVAYPAAVKIYPVTAGDPFETTNTEVWKDSTYTPAEGYEDLAQNVTYPVKEAVGSLDWQTINGKFTTNEFAEYRMLIYFHRISDAEGGYNNAQEIILSDFSLKEVVKGDAPAGDEMIAHPGVAIRKADESPNGQALRYKFTIDKNIITNALSDGYELVEYGTAVAYTDALVGYAEDPILNATRYNVRAGVAYQKEFGVTEPTKNIQYVIEANGDVTYTVALYNIPLGKYSFNISVRPYAKFQNAEGDTYIRYGTTRIASVFEVVKAILTSDNTDDIDYVNNTILVGSVKDDYETWIAEN